MTPIIYPSTENQFNTNGIGILADAVSCIVTEELNGEYELEMQYPITGIHYSEIKNRCLLFCNANRERNPQPFRIYRITKPINGIVTVYAEHISYDLSGVPVMPFTAGSAAGAMTALETGAAVASPFTFWTDKANAGNLAIATPVSSRAALGAGDNSILGIYGGELEFDRYTVRLHGQRGTDRGVSIRYGKNLTSLEQDENISNVYTGVYPYYTDGDNVIQLDELIVAASGSYDYERILPLDLSGEFDSAPTQAQLKAAAEEYIANNNIGVPEISLAVSFAQLEQTEEYKDLALLETVYMGDTVHVEFAALGVSASARCVKTVYNVLLDRYDSIELGDARKNIADTIAAQQQAINAVANGGGVSTAVQNAINAATALITGNKGGYVLIHSTTNSKQPDEILIMDKPTIEEAVKVWRWNNRGLGYSSTGYNGPYETAITQDGSIVADFITAGGMDAARITAGILSSADGRVQFDLTAGTLYIKDGAGTTKLGFDTAGNLSITGNITATGGKIGGFTISGNNLESTYCKIYPSTAGILSRSGGGLLLGSGAEIIGYSDDLHIYAGGTTIHGSLTVENGLNVTPLGSGNVEIFDVNFDYLSGYSNVVVYSTGGNLGTSSYPWGQCVAQKLYSSGGGVSSYSMRSLKKDIKPFALADGEFEKLTPVYYVMKNDPSERRQIGFIADDVKAVCPELVEEFEGEILTLDYSRITALLVDEVKKLRNRVAALEGE